MPANARSTDIEPLYRSLLAHTHEAVFVFDANGSVVDFSTQAEAMLGYSADELRGLSVTALIAPGELEAQLEIGARLQGRESLPVYERLMRHRNGIELPAEVSLSAIRNDAGEPTHFLAIIQDISERKAAEQIRAEASWFQSEQQRTQLLKQIADAVVTETPIDAMVAQMVAGLYACFPNYRVSFSVIDGDSLTVNHTMQPSNMPSSKGMKIAAPSLRDYATSPGSFEPFVIDDMAGSPHLHSIMETHLPKVSQALLGVPLPYGDKLVGMLALNSVEPHTWLAHEVDMLRECATYLSMAVAAAQAREQRQKSDAALRESERRYRILIDHFPNVSISLYDHDLRILVAGGAAMSLVDFSSAAVEGKTIYEVFPPPIITMLEPFMRDVLAGISQRHQMSFLDFTFDTQFIPVYDDQGRVVAGMTVTTDMTERKRAEEALAEKHHLLQTIVDSVPGHIFVKDRDSRFVVVNAAIAHTLGVTQEQLVGHTDSEFYPPEMVKAFIADDQWVIRTGKPVIDREEVDLDGEGRVRTVLTSKVPLRDRHGEIIGVIGQVQNITDRKRWEVELQRERDYTATILNMTPALMLVLDEQGRIITFNRACEQLSGYSAQEVIGRTPEFLLLPDNVDALWKMVADIQHGKRLEKYLNSWRLKDGSQRLIQWSGRAFNSPEGTIYLVASGIDISNSQELEQRKLELALEREKIRYLHEFVRDVSHDLQTPLSILSSSLGLMRRNSDPERQAKRIAVMELQVNRLMKLIDQLLTMSRLDSPDEVDHEPVDLAEIARGTASAFEKTAHERHLTFEADTGHDRLMVLGDSEHLSLALSNLLENALRYATTTVTLRTSRRGGEIVIEIGDDGSGIEAEDLPHIFERFYRGDKARSTETGGTGLGLSIARKIAEVHSGRIEVESIVGQGSLFRLLLPGQ